MAGLHLHVALAGTLSNQETNVFYAEWKIMVRFVPRSVHCYTISITIKV